jgi:hypothetical protein
MNTTPDFGTDEQRRLHFVNESVTTSWIECRDIEEVYLAGFYGASAPPIYEGADTGNPRLSL